MAMEESMTATIDAAQPKLAVFRNSRWCYFWAGLAFAGVLGAVLLGDRPLHYLPAILALYALQALFAEYLGVTVSAAGVAAPRRLSFLPPQLVMWRIHSSLTDIDNVTSLAKGNDGVVIFGSRTLHRFVCCSTTAKANCGFSKPCAGFARTSPSTEGDEAYGMARPSVRRCSFAGDSNRRDES